jgi:hypothetical protein
MTTFVTFFHKRPHATDDDMSIFFTRFHKLAESNVPILLFMDARCRSQGEELEKTYANVRIPMYVECPPNPTEYLLPKVRCEKKDTIEFMIFMLQKFKYMSHASYLVQTRGLAFVDFGIFKIFPEPDVATAAQNKLQQIAKTEPQSDTLIYNPGCLGPMPEADLHEKILWRYCGGFFWGRKELFREAYVRQTALVTKEAPKYTWEVNYWTRMDDLFCWFKADHNLEILNVI